MRIYTLIIIVLIFIACKETKKEIAPVQKTEDAVTSETQKMLQGTWINVQDTLSTIRFEGNTSKNSYNGIDTGREIFFTIGASCAQNQTVAPTQEDRFINTTGIAEECYYIEMLDKTTLIMKLMAEDIMLEFKKK